MARKQHSGHNFWLQLWSAPDSPHRENRTFLQLRVCAGHVRLALYCCSCPLPQEGKVLSMNFHSSWPVTFFSWRCWGGGGGQENRKAVTSSVVSLEGFLSHNDLSMANCSDSACPNNKVCLHMSQLAQICHALWGSKALGREKGGSHSTPVGATSLVQPVCSRLVFLPFCPHPVTPSHKFLSLWKLDGRSLLSRRTSTVGVFHFAVPV